MNITSRATHYASWDRRRLQQLLAVCVAGLAISVAIAVGVTSSSEPSGSSRGAAAFPSSSRIQSLPTYFYLVDTPEKANLVALSEQELAVTAPLTGHIPDHQTVVIDVSTLEGQQKLESINFAMAEAAWNPDALNSYRFIDWTE